MIIEALESIARDRHSLERICWLIANEPIAAAEVAASVSVLPEPLKDFYRVAGARRVVLANADYRVLSPDELRTEGDSFNLLRGA